MRIYQCYYYKKVGRGFILNQNKACWAGIVSTNYWKNKKIPKSIYIDISSGNQSKYHETNMNNITKLCYILNKITKCELVIHNNKEYIKYRYAFNNNYNKNLILLNVIRLIWDRDNGLDKESFFYSLLNYNEEDPLLFLTTCLRDNVISPKPAYHSYGDHSIVYPNIIPKTTKQLNDINISNIGTFIKSKYN